MKLEKGLTVAILTYNSAATIQKCLDSLLNQKYKNFYLLIVDDDSTDSTIKLVKSYETKLNVKIVKNGTHIIPKGRNIALRASRTEYVAFTDSDDSVMPGWTQVIINTFKKQPNLALITGDILPVSDTKTSKAIATNDTTIRKLFSKGVFLFSGGNCAFNRNLIGMYFFDEDFKYAEDSELFSRVKEKYDCKYVPSMSINYASRTTFKAYAKQMYLYGQWRLYYEFKAKEFRPIDFIPLCILVISGLATILFWSWLFLLTIVVFSLAEALFVVSYQRCTFQVALLTFPAWVIKNTAWSVGVARAIVKLVLNPRFRSSLIAKRIEEEK